jgi:hypothetical protein
MGEPVALPIASRRQGAVTASFKTHSVNFAMTVTQGTPAHTVVVQISAKEPHGVGTA